MAKKPNYLLKLRVDGPGIRSGSVPLPELIRICQAAQDAVSRQAEAQRGGKSLRPGPKQAFVQEECTLELFGKIGKGSSVLPLRLAKEAELLPTMRSFGVEVVHDVAQTVKALSSSHNGHHADIPPGVLASLAEMANALGRKVTYVEWIVPRFNGTPAVRAKFTKAVATRVREKMKAPGYQPESIEGVLEMVDFKPQDRKCRVKPPAGLPVVCTFLPEQEAEVQSNTNKPVRVEGMARINPHTGKIEEIAIANIVPIAGLTLGAQDFFANKSIETLAREQGVSPLSDPKVLIGGLPEDEDIDAFLSVIYQSRA